jgi:hypothetical protein
MCAPVVSPAGLPPHPHVVRPWTIIRDADLTPEVHSAGGGSGGGDVSHVSPPSTWTLGVFDAPGTFTPDSRLKFLALVPLARSLFDVAQYLEAQNVVHGRLNPLSFIGTAAEWRLGDFDGAIRCVRGLEARERFPFPVPLCSPFSSVYSTASCLRLVTAGAAGLHPDCYL